jgi:hypothetical protein
MAHSLKALTDLPEDLGLNPSTHIDTHRHKHTHSHNM